MPHIALVTGANQGLGFALVGGLAARLAPEDVVLLTGRGSSAQWHTNTRTGKSAVLRKLYPAEPQLEIHPDDAARLKIGPGDRVTVESRRGKAQARAMPASTVQPGQLFLTMHGEDANKLTFPAFDPHSRQPSYKHCAVRVAKERS